MFVAFATRPLLRDGGAWLETMVPQKPGNSPRPRPEIIERKEGVLGQMALDAARRALKSTESGL